eukprot:3938985-Rhodomonas_salina.1
MIPGSTLSTVESLRDDVGDDIVKNSTSKKEKLEIRCRDSGGMLKILTISFSLLLRIRSCPFSASSACGSELLSNSTVITKVSPAEITLGIADIRSAFAGVSSTSRVRMSAKHCELERNKQAPFRNSISEFTSAPNAT